MIGSMKNHRDLASLSMVVIAAGLLAPGAIGCTDAGNPVNGNPSGEFSEIENAVHAKINAYRATKGLPPLGLVSVMVTQARAHSSNMAARKGLDHNGFQERVIEIQKTVPLVSAAENVAFNMGFDDPAQEAVNGWLESSGHRVNIEGDFNVTGIGVERSAGGEYYFTQIFGKR